MTTAKLTSKGQITIPIDVRNDLKVGSGDRVEFVQIAPGRYEIVAITSDVTSLKGMFEPPKKTVSIESRNASISLRGAAARCNAVPDLDYDEARESLLTMTVQDFQSFATVLNSACMPNPALLIAISLAHEIQRS